MSFHGIRMRTPLTCLVWHEGEMLSWSSVSFGQQLLGSIDRYDGMEQKLKDYIKVKFP